MQSDLSYTRCIEAIIIQATMYSNKHFVIISTLSQHIILISIKEKNVSHISLHNFAHPILSHNHTRYKAWFLAHSRAGSSKFQWGGAPPLLRRKVAAPARCPFPAKVMGCVLGVPPLNPPLHFLQLSGKKQTNKQKHWNIWPLWTSKGKKDQKHKHFLQLLCLFVTKKKKNRKKKKRKYGA